MCIFTSKSSTKDTQQSPDMESSRYSSQEVLCKEESSSLKRCRICFMSTESLPSGSKLSCLSKMFNHHSSLDRKSQPKDDELLTNVCFCRGSVGAVHKSCLQKWLSISNSTSCDLCHGSFKHLLIQKPKTFSDFLSSSSSTMSWKSYFWVDILSFVLLTPVTSVSLSLCLKGLLYYAKSVAEYISLITLMALLITTYIMWLITCSYQHLKSFRDWRKVNFDIVVDGNGANNTGPRKLEGVPTISGSLSQQHSLRTWSRVARTDIRRQRIPGGFIRTSDINDDVTMMRAAIATTSHQTSRVPNITITRAQTSYPGRFLSHPTRSRINNDSLLEPYAYSNAYIHPLYLGHL